MARWYVIHVHSGFERKVRESILEQAERHGMMDQIEDIVVPVEEVTEVRRGIRVKTERKFFPGYVLLRVCGEQITDHVWHLVIDTPKVTGFLGSKGRPSPISEEEANRVLQQEKDGVDRLRPSVTFVIGEPVRVSDGPFTSFSGVVEEVDEEKARLKVAVSIFGRATPVDLEYTQVEKV